MVFLTNTKSIGRKSIGQASWDYAEIWQSDRGVISAERMMAVSGFWGLAGCRASVVPDHSERWHKWGSTKRGSVCEKLSSVSLNFWWKPFNFANCCFWTQRMQSINQGIAMILMRHHNVKSISQTITGLWTSDSQIRKPTNNYIRRNDATRHWHW